MIYERLLGLTRRLCEPTGVDELLREIAAAGAELLGADRVSVFVHDRSTHELWAKVADGQDALRVPADRGLVGEALRTGRSVVVPDVTADPRFNAAVDRATGYRTRTLLTVPMLRGGGGAEGGRVVGVMQFLNKGGAGAGAGFNDRDAKWAEVLAAQAAVVLERALMEAEREGKRALEKEMAVAREVQEASWPATLPSVAGYSLAGWAEAASAAGGDTYDAVVADLKSHGGEAGGNSGGEPGEEGGEEGGGGGLWVLIADATGHGVGPALASAQVRSMFRMAVHAGLSVDQAMRYTHRQVILDMPAGRFVTAFMGRLDPKTHELEYASAGHGPVFIVRTRGGLMPANDGAKAGGDEGGLVELETTGLPLGIDFGMEPEPACRVKLGPGDGLVLFTDGLFEALDPQEKTMGIEAVREVLLAKRKDGASAVLDGLREVLDRHAAGRAWEDDVTMLVVVREG